MLFKSTSHAKVLLALSVAIGLTSFHFGQKWSASAKSASSSASKLVSDVSKTKELLASLSSELEADKQPMDLAQATSTLMLEIFNKRTQFNVTVSSAAPNKTTGGSMADMSALADDVPGSKLKSIRVNLTGTYADYQGLRQYLESLQSLPVSLVRLKVQEQAFEAGFRVYGVLKN